MVTRDVAVAAALLTGGGLVAFPTETVYGLGADAANPMAVRAVFAAKGRPADNPLIVHIADPDDLGRIAVVTELAASLRRRFWPGPLTLVLPAHAGVLAEVRAGLPTVAVRCPDHPLAQALITSTGRPVAAPSANRSGRPSPTTAAAVLEDLDGRINGVLDGGPCRLGLESTVVDCTGGRPKILRLGALPAEALGLDPTPDPAAAGKSPGTLYRHYAPAIPVHVVDELELGLRRFPDAAVLCAAREARRLGIEAGPAAEVWAETPEGRAAGLFSALRRLERSGCRAIVVSRLPATGLDAATMDRLNRAAADPEKESPSAAGNGA